MTSDLTSCRHHQIQRDYWRQIQLQHEKRKVQASVPAHLVLVVLESVLVVTPQLLDYRVCFCECSVSFQRAKKKAKV